MRIDLFFCGPAHFRSRSALEGLPGNGAGKLLRVPLCNRGDDVSGRARRGERFGPNDVRLASTLTIRVVYYYEKKDEQAEANYRRAV